MPTRLDALQIGGLKVLDEPVSIHSGILRDVSLVDAVARVADALRPGRGQVVALLQGVTGFRFAVLQDRELCGRPGDPMDAASLNTVYEARLFRQTNCLPELAELRWLHEGGGKGRAVWVATNPDGFGDIGEPGGVEPCSAIIAASGLLWGLVDSSKDGWTALSEARVGRLCVPHDGATGDRPRLLMRSVELVATEPEYGNCYVTEELIHGFQWA